MGDRAKVTPHPSSYNPKVQLPQQQKDCSDPPNYGSLGNQRNGQTGENWRKASGCVQPSRAPVSEIRGPARLQTLHSAECWLLVRAQSLPWMDWETLQGQAPGVCRYSLRSRPLALLITS
ncbi:hypothetical protein ACOMHN_048682 [Nucella lapillus]